MRRMLKSVLFFIIILILILIFNPTVAYCEGEENIPGDEYAQDAEESGMADEEAEVVYYRARVTKVLKEVKKETEHSGGSIESNTQVLEVLILKGPHKGEKVQALYELNLGLSDKYQSIQLSEGDEVLLYLEENEMGSVENAYVAEIARDKYLLYLVIGFVLVLLLIGAFL